jgi:hypothetical protein
MGYTNFPHGITSMGVPILGSGQDVSGKTWFVDGNMGNDGNTGDSWDRPFLTLAKAFAVSHADIADSSQKHWARRNTIYVAGDTFAETLVAFPQKTDVIGVGSYDANPRAGITGHHAPVNTAIGTRFFNIHWKAEATASPIITLASDSAGIEFYNCVFDGVVGTVTTGITATAATFLKVQDCEFWGVFATAAISFGAGAAVRAEIIGNRITGATIGILINASTTFAYDCIVDRNIICAATITIDDNADLAYVTNNELISAGAGATVGTMADAMQCDINVFRASNNRLACSNVCGIVVPPVDSTT